MFEGFMLNTWLAASIVAVVAGAVGFFTVLRGSAFAAHAIPQCGFAGAAAASLVGLSTLVGLGAFAAGAAVGIAWMGRRGRHDVVVALALALVLGCGALFLGFSVEYAPEIYSLLFGEVLGIASTELLPTAVLGILCLVAVVILYRPLMLSSVIKDAGEARGVSGNRMEVAFLLVVALVTTMSVPVVGALLVFSVMIGAPGAARSFTSRPVVALVLSMGFALVIVWIAIAMSYLTNWPVGFYVGVLGAVAYIVGRSWAAWVQTRTARPGQAAVAVG